MFPMGPFRLRIVCDSMTIFHVLKSVRKKKKEIQINHALAFIRTLSHVRIPEDKKNIT